MATLSTASEPVKKKPKKKKKKKDKKKSNATPAKKRLMRDFKKMLTDNSSGVSAAPVDSNIFQWQAVLLGPGDTPWEGGTFHLLMDFTEEYPNSPPSVKFVTNMFHPNVSQHLLPFTFFVLLLLFGSHVFLFLWVLLCRFTPTGVQRWKDMPGHSEITVEPHLRHHQHFNLHSIFAR